MGSSSSSESMGTMDLRFWNKKSGSDGVFSFLKTC